MESWDEEWLCGHRLVSHVACPVVACRLTLSRSSLKVSTPHSTGYRYSGALQPQSTSSIAACAALRNSCQTHSLPSFFMFPLHASTFRVA